MTLDQLRSIKQAHALLTESFPGLPIIGYAIRSFGFCEPYAVAAIAENKLLALTRCWKDLERLFMRDRAFLRGLLRAELSVTTSCILWRDSIVLESKQKLTTVTGRTNPVCSLLCLQRDDDRP